MNFLNRLSGHPIKSDLSVLYQIICNSTYLTTTMDLVSASHHLWWLLASIQTCLRRTFLLKCPLICITLDFSQVFLFVCFCLWRISLETFLIICTIYELRPENLHKNKVIAVKVIVNGVTMCSDVQRKNAFSDGERLMNGRQVATKYD